ncbi:MAG: hypothetical protein ACREFJ_01900 [Acetobacteraceae bacterium]
MIKPSGMDKGTDAKPGGRRGKGRGRGEVVPRVAEETETLRVAPPAGETLVAPLPGGVRRHFGPELRRVVLMRHLQGQVMVERLVAMPEGIGISIAKREVMRLLLAGQAAFLTESRGVLRRGLQTASWISVDDTGAIAKI